MEYTLISYTAYLFTRPRPNNHHCDLEEIEVDFSRGNRLLKVWIYRQIFNSDGDELLPDVIFGDEVEFKEMRMDTRMEYLLKPLQDKTNLPQEITLAICRMNC
jgi:hypothetical protein